MTITVNGQKMEPIEGSIDGIPVTETAFGTVEGLPDPQEGVCYIVSLLVQQRGPHRSDVYRPDMGPALVVRDAAGPGAADPSRSLSDTSKTGTQPASSSQNCPYTKQVNRTTQSWIAKQF
jgi:hypothetical protein